MDFCRPRQYICEMSSQGEKRNPWLSSKAHLLDYNTMLLFLLCFNPLSQIPTNDTQQNLNSSKPLTYHHIPITVTHDFFYLVHQLVLECYLHHKILNIPWHF